MLPSLNIGSLAIPTAGLVIILGAWLSLDAVERGAQKTGQVGETVYGVAATSLLAGVIGARAIFVWRFWPAFADNLVSIVWPLTNGYSVVGGLIVGGITAVYLSRFRRLPFIPMLDAVTPGLLLALIAVSLAEFLSGSSFGTSTNVPWAVSLAGIRRHPVQLYEILLGLAALFIWWRTVNRIQYPAISHQSKSGDATPNSEFRTAYAGQGRPFLHATALYATGRLFLDAYRANTPLTESGFHIIQLICLALALVALFLLRQLSAEAGATEPLSSAENISSQS